jgi:hypothetical protein
MRSPTRAGPPELLLTDCHLIDGVSDEPMRNSFVHVRDGKVVATGAMKKAPRSRAWRRSTARAAP